MRDTDLTDPGPAGPTGTDAAPAPAPGAAEHDLSSADAVEATGLRKVSRAVVSVAAGTSVDPFDREGYARDTNRGYGDAMGRGLELALTVAAMTGIGWLVDRVTGTAPLFIAIFSIIGFVGISVKLWIGYDLEMRKHDEGAIWSRSTAVTPKGAVASSDPGPAGS